MAIPFLSDIKLNGNQIKELVVDHKSGSQPTTGYHGQLIFRSDQNKVYLNTSTNTSSPSWLDITSGDITSVAVNAGEGLEVEAGSASASTGDFSVTLGLAATVAGDGLSYSSGVLAVGVDNSTIELSGDAVRVKDNGITLDKLAHQANNTVVKMSSSGVPTAGTIVEANIADDAVTGAKIAADAIDSEHYAADSIDTEHYAAGSVDTTALGTGAVTTIKIENGAVSYSKLGDIPTQSVIGRYSANTGDPQTVSPANFRPFLKTALGGGFASNALTIGDSDDTITILGNLIVSGTQTIQNETVQIVENNTIEFEGTTDDSNTIKLTGGDPTANRTVALPNASGTVALTSDIGDATITITAGAGLVTGGNFTTNASVNKTITIDHEDTSSQASVDNSGLNVIQDVTLDTYGHVTGLASVDLQSGIDGRITAREYAVALTPGGTSGQQGYITKTSNTYTVYHALGTIDIICQVIETGSPYATAQVDVQRSSTNEVKVLFGQSVTNGDYKILITKIG